MVTTWLFEATGRPARQRVQCACLGLRDRSTPEGLRTKPARAGSAPQPGTPQRLAPGRPGQTRLLRPETHEARPAPLSAPRPKQALTERRPGKRPPWAERDAVGRRAERRRAAGPLPLLPGCPPPARLLPGTGPGLEPRRCAHPARSRPRGGTGLRPAARVQGRGPTPASGCQPSLGVHRARPGPASRPFSLSLSCRRR